MPPAPPSATQSRTLAWLCGFFILAFFTLFSYHGYASYFTFDDGTTVVSVLRFFDSNFWEDLLHTLIVFTSAFRPLTTMFWRPLYALFGYDPLPYRIVVQLLLTANIPLVYLWARRLDAPREASALTALVFCYNASMLDFFYNTCLVGDVTCFLFYGLAFMAYVRGRQSGGTGGWKTIVLVLVYFFLSLDSKEQAVTLPGMLLLYEILFRTAELRNIRNALRVCALPLAMLVMDVVYLQVKVADMSRNPDYNPHVTVEWVLRNIAHNVEQLLYFPLNSLTPVTAFLILGAAAAVAALLRSRQAIFGVLFFIATLIPIAVIQPRAGYAAYIPYFGMCLTIGAILSAARTRIVRLPRLQTASAVFLFLFTAVIIGWGHIVNRMPGTGYYEWSNPGIANLLDNFEHNIPEFPHGARVLLTGDPWEPDWGPMFLVRMLYHDNSIWVDRPKNLKNQPDPMAYDIVVHYQQPDVELKPARLFKHWNMPWEVRGRSTGTGQFVISSPHANGAGTRLKFDPPTVRKGQSSRLTVPGVSNTPVTALYRMVTAKSSTVHLVEDWCKLDDAGSCTIHPPEDATGALMVDWIQPKTPRWTFTSGTLIIQE